MRCLIAILFLAMAVAGPAQAVAAEAAISTAGDEWVLVPEEPAVISDEMSVHAAPLPSSVWTGLAMLGAMAGISLVRRCRRGRWA